jgi:hypothetical protein
VFTESLPRNGLFRHNTLNIRHNNALTSTDDTVDRLLVLMPSKLARMPSFNMDVAGLSLYHEGKKNTTNSAVSFEVPATNIAGKKNPITSCQLVITENNSQRF